MKVCFITGEYPPMRGGVADYTETLAHSLQGIGVEPCILTSTRAAQKNQTAYPVLAEMDDWGFGACRRITKLVGESGADVVHIQYQTAAYGMQAAVNLLPFWLHRRLACRVVSTLHDLREPYLFPKAGPLRSWVNRRLISDSDAVIATNAEDLERARELAPHASVSLIPIASSIPVAVPPHYDRELVRLDLGIGAADCLLSYFGMLNQSKGLEFLMPALRQLVDAGLRVKLMILGEEVGDADPTNRAYRDRILAAIKRLGLEDVVIRTGYKAADEVSACLSASDVCVLPFVDGASFRRTSLLAALDHGLPVVTTRGSGDQPGLVDGENCSLVPAGDAGALAAAVGSLVSSASLRERLRNGALALSKGFSWGSVAEQTVDLYRQLLARAR